MNTKLNGTEMRAEWIAAGGKIHGPNVETVTMPEADYFRFRASLEAAMPHLQRQPAELALDVEAMLTACVPGGSIVDPQVVADNIRAWAAELRPAELAEQQGVELPPLPEAHDMGYYIDSTMRKGTMTGYTRDQMRDYARAAIAATGKQQVGVPDGWRLVPIEPTWGMRNEGREFLIEGMEQQPERAAYFLWKTMVAAAPEVE